jgi:hypothetical protein
VTKDSPAFGVLSIFNVRDVFAVAPNADGLKLVAITTRDRKNATLFTALLLWV